MLNIQDWVFLPDTRLWHGLCTQLQWKRFPRASCKPANVWGICSLFSTQVVIELLLSYLFLFMFLICSYCLFFCTLIQ